MSFHKIDTPANGHCGFYAFAFGLLHLISQESLDSRPLYRRWIELDSEIQPSIDAFLQILKDTDEPKDLAEKKQELITEIQVIKTPTTHPFFQNQAIERQFKAKNLGFLLNESTKRSLFVSDADVAAIVNPLQFDLGGKFVKACDEIQRTMLDTFKNSIKRILLTKMQADLEELALPGFDDDLRPNKFKLYQDFGELIDRNGFMLPHNFLSKSPVLNEIAKEIQKKLAGPLEPLQKEKKYVLMRDAFVRHKSAFLQQINASYASDTPWWATDQDLLQLAEILDCRVSIIKDATPPAPHHLPTMYLHNPSGAHWTTLIDSAEHAPIAAPVRVQVARSELPKEQNRLTLYRSAQDKTKRYDELTALIIEQYQGENNPAVIQELKRRRDCHTQMLELLKHGPQESSNADKEYHAYCLVAYQSLAGEEADLSIDDFDAATREVEQDLKRYKKEEFYPKLLKECSVVAEIPPGIPQMDMRRIPSLLFPPEPSPNISKMNNYLIAAGIGIALPALGLNAIPGVMPALLAATGMTVISANLVFILLGVYLASMLTLLYNVYQESQTPSIDLNPFGLS